MHGPFWVTMSLWLSLWWSQPYGWNAYCVWLLGLMYLAWPFSGLGRCFCLMVNWMGWSSFVLHMAWLWHAWPGKWFWSRVIIRGLGWRVWQLVVNLGCHFIGSFAWLGLIGFNKSFEVFSISLQAIYGLLVAACLMLMGMWAGLRWGFCLQLGLGGPWSGDWSWASVQM